MKILFLLLSTAAVLTHGNKLVGHIQDTRLCLIASILLGLLCVCTVTALLLNGRRHRPACPHQPAITPLGEDYATPTHQQVAALQKYNRLPIHFHEFRKSQTQNKIP